MQGVLVIGAIIIVTIFIIILEAGRRAKERHDRKITSETTFNLKVSDLGLTEKEKEEIEKMAGPKKYDEMNSIISSINIFEHHVDKEIERLGITPDPFKKTKAEETITGIRKKLRFNYLDNDYPLVSTRNISIGQPMVLLNREGRTVIQMARVVTNKELFFRVQYDTQLEPKISLQRGDRIKVAFPRHGDAMYEIDLTVAAFERPGWIDFYHTLNLTRRQLRRDVRLDANFPLKLRVLETSDPVEKERLGKNLINGRISDISGGGLSFLIDSPLKPEDILSLNFSLSETPVTGIQAKLLRVNPQQIKDETFFRHHMQYLGIDPIQKEKIVKYVFEKMRERKQNEKD